MKRQFTLLIVFFTFAQVDFLSATMAKPERLQDQLIGPVKTVMIEFAKLNSIDGKWVPESPRTPWLEATYADNGYLMEEEQFYTEKTLDFKSVFHYDADGNLSDGIEYDYKGTITFKWDYSHYPSERRIEKRKRFPDGTLFSITNFYYDDQGNLLEEKRKLQQTKNHFIRTFLYDTQGRKIEEAYYLERPGNPPGKIKSLLNFRTVFKFDKKGNLIEEIQYDASGNLSSKRQFEYEFDPVGNWIIQTALEAVGSSDKAPLEPNEITYRTMTYYNQ